MISYYAAASIGSVQPSNGPLSGGNHITILGANLGSGTDITAVLLGGLLCTVKHQTTSTVTVLAAVGTSVGVTNITVASTSFGTSVKTSVYTYNSRTYTM